MELTIASPSSSSTWASPFSVTGTCDSAHTVKVTVTGPATNVTEEATPNNGDWSVSFNNAGLQATARSGPFYTITARCGDPATSTSVDNIKI